MTKRDDFLECMKGASEVWEKAPICVRCGVKIDLVAAHSRGKCANCEIDFEDTMHIAQNLIAHLRMVLYRTQLYMPDFEGIPEDSARAYLEQIKDMGDDYATH